MDEASIDLDWLPCGIGEVAADGTIRPRNTALSELLGEVRSIGELDLSDADRRRFEDGEVATVESPFAPCFVQQHERDGRRFLVARRADALHLEHSTARVRLLGELGGTIVHQLANRVGVLLAFSEHLEDVIPPENASRLAGMVGAAKDTVELLRAVARMLERRPGRANGIELPTVAKIAVRLVEKHGGNEGRPVEIECALDVPPVIRVVHAEAVQAVVTVLLLALETGRGPLTVDVSRSSGERRYGTIRIGDGGEAEAYARLPERSHQLALAVFHLRRSGGDYEVAREGDGSRTIELRWPEVVP